MKGGHILVAPTSPHADLKAAIAADALADLARACETSDARIVLAGVTLLPVIPDPGKILCVGLNYETHRRENGRDVVENPTILTRFADSQAAQGQPLLRPRVSTDFDHEGELAVVIGKGGRCIPRSEAMRHVPATPATMTARCATCGATPSSSRRERTSRKPAASGPGPSRPTRSPISIPSA